MMGRTHVLSGLAAGALTFTALPGDPETYEYVGWVLAVGATALLPDIDHPRSTVTGMWGSATRLLSRAVTLAANGHRAGTHDMALAPPGLAFLFWVASLTMAGQLTATALVIGLALRAVAMLLPGARRDHPLVNLTCSLAGAWALVTEEKVPEWLPFAVAIGVFVHIAGDAITEGGIPVPLSWITGAPRRLPGGPIDTGGAAERYVVAPALLIALAWGLTSQLPRITDALAATPLL